VSRRFSIAASLAALTVIAAAARIRHLGVQILGGDELHLLDVITTTDLATIPRTVLEYDFSIPLALAFSALASLAPLTETTLRLPGLVAGIALPFATYAATRRGVGRSAALLGAAVLAVHTFAVFHSRFARPYALVALLVLAVLALLERSRARDTTRAALAAAPLAGLAMWINLPAALAMAAVYAGALIAALAGRGRRVRASLRVIASGALALLLAAIAYYPAREGLAREVLAGKLARGMLTRDAVEDALHVMAGTASLPLALAFAALVVVGCVWLALRRPARAAPLLAPLLLLPIAVVASRPSLLEYHMVLPRYLFAALPLAIVAAAFVVDRILAVLLPRGRVRPGVRLALPWLAVPAVVVASPYVSLYGAPRAFTHHPQLQEFRHLRGGAGFEVWPPPPFEFEVVLAGAPRVVVWPPPKGYDQNFYVPLEAAVGRPLELLIEDDTPFSSPLLHLRTTVRLAEASQRLPSGTLVAMIKDPSRLAEVRRRGGLDGARIFPRGGPKYLRVREALLRELGNPVFEDPLCAIFRVP
jgi:hypothetical protein